MNRKVIIDAGHGGIDPGAVYQGRMEKDDNLQLAFDLGSELERRGIGVEYTRVTDVYDTPLEKAQIANQSGSDFFISLHRNAMPVPETASGVESLVFSMGRVAADLAANVNEKLAEVGWKDLGIKERPGLAVLRKTGMPAVLVEVGFIDNTKDNEFFDNNRAAAAEAIAEGILKTFEEQETEKNPSGEIPGFYVVQTGVFRRRDYAEEEQRQLELNGFSSHLVAKNGLYYVRSGAFKQLEYAIAREQELRKKGFDTWIVRT